MAKSHPQAKIKSSSQVTIVYLPDVLPSNDAPLLTEGQKLSADIIDFLRGVERGEWGINHSGRVRGVTLETTGSPLSDKRHRAIIRELVRLNWIQTKGRSKSSGYALVMPAGDILRKMGF